MKRSHSIVPLDHFTTGLTDAQLIGLAERHGVRFEVLPHQAVQRGVVAQHGWEILLYGSNSEADRVLGGEDAHHHVHDVLHALARAALPAGVRPSHVELERYTGAIMVDARCGFQERVRMRVVVDPPGPSQAEAAHRANELMDSIRDRLAALGAGRG